MSVFKNLVKAVGNVVVAGSNVVVEQSKRMAVEAKERSGKFAVMAEVKSAELLAKSEAVKAATIKPVVVEQEEEK
jgi:hypothetical protein